MSSTEQRCSFKEYCDRDSWLEDRRQGIGGSDAPAIMGVSDWAGPYKVWATKMCPEALPDIRSNAAKWGSRLEGTVRKGFAEDYEGIYRVLECGLRSYWVKGKSHLRYSPDGFLESVKEPEKGVGLLEIKTSKLGIQFDRADGIPKDYLHQMQHGMMVLGLQWGVLVALIGGSEPRVFHVERDDDWCSAAEGIFDGWWRTHIEQANAPEPNHADMEAVKAVAGDPLEGKEITLRESWVLSNLMERNKLKTQIKETEQAVQQIDAKVLERIGSAEVAEVPGWGKVTFKTVIRKEHVRKASVKREARFYPARKKGASSA